MELLYHFHESLKSFIVKILFKKNLLWLHSPQGLSEYHYTLKTRPTLNKIRFSNELNNFWVLEFVFQQERKNVFLCVCVLPLPICFLPDWLYHPPNHDTCIATTLFRIKSSSYAEHKVRGLPDSPALSLHYPQHNSNNNLPFPETRIKFPIPEPMNSTGTPVFFTSLTQISPLDLSSAQIPVWKVVPLYIPHLVCNVWQKSPCSGENFYIKCESKRYTRKKYK